MTIRTADNLCDDVWCATENYVSRVDMEKGGSPPFVY